MDSSSYINDEGCNCCKGHNVSTPVRITNMPGQSSLSYRIGTFSKFKRSMLTHLSSNEILSSQLTTRDERNDLANAILDSTAITLDVLTFYQERIANEGFIQTATERRSILELAKEIGYQLRPGVAASTCLAFLIEDAPGSNEKTIIDVRTKAQTIPSNSEMPQVFETTEKIEARPSWNNLRPKLTERQVVNEYSSTLYLTGVVSQLNPGDGILVVKGNRGNTSNPPLQTFFRLVEKVEPDTEKQTTKVTLLGASLKAQTIGDISVGIDVSIPTDMRPVAGANLVAKPYQEIGITGMSQDQKDALASSSWEMSELALVAARNGLQTQEFAHILQSWAIPLIAIAEDPGFTQVFVMRIKAGNFGSNAPGYRNLPENIVGNYPDWDTPPLAINKKRFFDNTTPKEDYYDVDRGNEGNLIFLDNVYSTILPTSGASASWVVLKGSHLDEPLICKVKQTIEENIVGFSLNSRVTGLKLDISNSTEIEKFHVRTTTIYAKNEELHLADIPLNNAIRGNSIVLERQETHLKVGQIVAISGSIVDNGDKDLDITRSEIAIISEISMDAYARTILKFRDNLQNSYQRQSVNINANVAKASHGQTKSIVLGGGDPSKKIQNFILREKPVTFLTSPTERGVKSTLEIFVDDIKWREEDSFNELGPSDRAFVTRLDNSSQLHIFFGDGIHGKLPSAGLDNIRARYRIGVGSDGIAKAGQISGLLDRPAGVKSVSNPISAEDAADPETMDRARENAPLTVLTLGRIVSLTDYEDFANAFAGIGKAHAMWIWSAGERVVHLTVATETASTVGSTSELYKSLVNAINKFKDPVTKFQLGDFVLVLFNIQAGIFVSEGYNFEIVKEKVEESLTKTFSFKARQFGQAAPASEVIASIQRIEGVDAVDLDYFYLSEEKPQSRNVISAHIAHWDDIKKLVIPAEIAILNTIPGAGGLIITERKRRMDSNNQ